MKVGVLGRNFRLSCPVEANRDLPSGKVFAMGAWKMARGAARKVLNEIGNDLPLMELRRRKFGMRGWVGINSEARGLFIRRQTVLFRARIPFGLHLSPLLENT